MTPDSLLTRLLLIGIFAASPTYAGAQDASRQNVLPPARPQLLPVPLPQLDSLESSVARQIREVQQSFDKVLARPDLSGRDLAEAYGSLGQLYHAYEFFEAADASYRNASRLDANDYQWHHLLGYLHEQTGRLEESIEFYQAALRLRPDDHVATLHLGDVYLRLNRRLEAREQFEAALARFPAAALNRLGELALAEGRFKDAIRHLEGALQRVPDASRLHYPLAMAYRGLGQLERAQSHLQQVGPGDIRPVDPVVESLQGLLRGERVHLILGRLAYQGGQYKDAAAAFGKAVDAAPTSAAARVNLGLAQWQLSNSVAAREQFEAALRLDASNVTAHTSLGIMFVQQGRDAESINHLRAALLQAPDNVTVRGELIGALVRLRRQDEAILILEKARAANPEDERTLVSLSILLADRERYREALALLDDANRRFPERTTTTTTLARLLAASPNLSLRDGRRALELAMAVYETEPTAVHAETVALSLAELGRCMEAMEWMRRAVTDADRAGDGTETARLKSEMPRYEVASCRPPGR